jgi:hypothetical protein
MSPINRSTEISSTRAGQNAAFLHKFLAGWVNGELRCNVSDPPVVWMAGPRGRADLSRSGGEVSGAARLVGWFWLPVSARGGRRGRRRLYCAGL